MELQGIDPRTSHMLSERSTIWATAPYSVFSWTELNKSNNLKFEINDYE